MSKNSLLAATFTLLLCSCNTPDSGQNSSFNGLQKTFSSVGRDGLDYSNSLNDFMGGPTRPGAAGCPTGEYNSGLNVDAYPLSYDNTASSSIKGEPQVMWNECNPELKSNYVDERGPAQCARRKVSKEFIEFFDVNFNACVQKAYSAQIGGSDLDFSNLSFMHKGITGDSRHSNRSLHSVNRAIDFAQVKFTANGRVVEYNARNQRRSPDKEFFDNFRACWSDKINEHKRNCPGGNMKGSIGAEDSDHTQHVHLSLPYCPGRSGFYSK